MSDLRQACFKPPVAQKSRHSAIDGRTTRLEGYALFQKHRKKIEEPFGWAKTVDGMEHNMYLDVERVRSSFIMILAANNLAPKFDKIRRNSSELRGLAELFQ